jgi:hypothetical protein
MLLDGMQWRRLPVDGGHLSQVRRLARGDIILHDGGRQGVTSCIDDEVPSSSLWLWQAM